MPPSAGLFLTLLLFHAACQVEVHTLDTYLSTVFPVLYDCQYILLYYIAHCQSLHIEISLAWQRRYSPLPWFSFLLHIIPVPLPPSSSSRHVQSISRKVHAACENMVYLYHMKMGKIQVAYLSIFS